jgi:tetratricopeptide (TPR) repeat protein
MSVSVLHLRSSLRPPDSIRSVWSAGLVLAWLGLSAVCPGAEVARSFRARAADSSGTSEPVVPEVSATEALPPAQAEAAALKREAVAAARLATEQYPDDALAYALLGSAHYNIGQSEEATRYLKKCLSLRPDQGDAYEVLARAAYEKGELDEAVRYAGEAAQRGVVSADLLNRWGRALLDLGRWEESVEVL